MALMIFGIVLNRNGWRIGYLGPRTPIEELARAAGTSHSGLVVLAATVPETLEPLQPGLASLARHLPLALAGAGATPQTASAVGARLMTRDPATEAEQPDGRGETARAPRVHQTDPTRGNPAQSP